MGSIEVDNIPYRDQPGHKSVYGSSEGQANGASFKSFEVTGLADYENTITGMKDEILLLSWLIVLLRTREGSQVHYEWAHKSQENRVERETAHSLSMSEVIPQLQTSVSEAAAAISRHIATVKLSEGAAQFSSALLLLSSGSLSRASEQCTDGVSYNGPLW